MKYLTTFLIIAILFFSCSEQPKQDNVGQQTNDTTNVVADSLLYRYTVKAKDSVEGIVIMDNLTHQEIKWKNVPNFYFNRSPSPEYHKPNLYLTRNFNVNNAKEWKEELWVYNQEGGKLLVSKQGINYSVNNKQTLLAYNSYFNTTYRGDTLMIMDLRNNKTRTVKVSNDTNKISESWIESLTWSTDKDIIWGLLGWVSASHYFFFSYNYTTNALKQYPIPDSLAFEYNINPNTGQLLYSTYPPTYDNYDYQYLKENKLKISLYLLDFATNKRTRIKTNISNKFNAYWITNHLIEFSIDSLNHRETLTLKE